jgi:hypothetical protein
VDLILSKALNKVILEDIKSLFGEVINKEEQGSFAACFNNIIIRNIISLKISFFFVEYIYKFNILG